MKKFIRVYVAGAYNADNAPLMFNNMRKGMRICAELLKMGIIPFCPWLDFHFALVGDGFENTLTLEDFYEYSIAWELCCDYLLLVPGWENSAGTLNEIRIAEENNIPVFKDINELVAQILLDKGATLAMVESIFGEMNYFWEGVPEKLNDRRT